MMEAGYLVLAAAVVWAVITMNREKFDAFIAHRRESRSARTANAAASVIKDQVENFSDSAWAAAKQLAELLPDRIYDDCDVTVRDDGHILLEWPSVRPSLLVEITDDTWQLTTGNHEPVHGSNTSVELLAVRIETIHAFSTEDPHEHH